MIYLDVRTKEEYDEEHIDGAIHLDVDDIAQGKNPACAKNEEIITYCFSGARAGAATELLRDRGFTNVTNGGGYADVLRSGAHFE